ncbi:hypothetical protein AB8Q18_07250 [Neisseriaceae bacterium CLB008]
MWFNLLKPPFEVDTLNAWAHFIEDIAKVALIALPVVLYGDSSNIAKSLNAILLLFISYGSLLLSRRIRQYRLHQTGASS